MTVSWSPPTDDGGRTDDYYYVEISDPDNLGSYRDGQYLSGTSRSRSFSGLRRCTQYCVRVTAHNGVSDQDPDRVNTRTVEVCEETRHDRTFAKNKNVRFTPIPHMQVLIRLLVCKEHSHM